MVCYVASDLGLHCFLRPVCPDIRVITLYNFTWDFTCTIKKILKLNTHFFCKNISIYAIFNDQSFNDMLANDIVSFEQLGPDFQCK